MKRPTLRIAYCTHSCARYLLLAFLVAETRLYYEMLSTLTEDGFGEDRTGGTSTAGCLRFTDALLRLKYSDAGEDDSSKTASSSAASAPKPKAASQGFVAEAVPCADDSDSDSVPVWGKF